MLIPHARWLSDPGRFGRLVGMTALLLTADFCSGDEVHFNTDVRPLLAEFCIECHGPDANRREADLRLDLEAEAKADVIVPGDPDQSELIRRIVSADLDERMPPADSGKTLDAEQVEILRRWIRDGAHYQQHWSLEGIREVEPPKLGDEGLTKIDRFIVSALRRQGLSLAPPLSRQQLIRRATFDLTGLPPTWQQVESFVSDESPDAFAKVVDRLLDSAAYGQRWGRHWLDIARYADTRGGSAIGFTRFPFSYTYRDYVIDAFNRDLPYNEFITQQLAADQMNLADGDPALAALGFLTVGMQYRNPHDTIDDQIDVVTRGLLGLTVACARCHDHKYDAIPTEDYYSLYATFASSSAPDMLPLIGQPKPTPAYREYQAELARRQTSYDDMAREQNEVMRGRLRMQVGDYLAEIVKGAGEIDVAEAFLSFRTDDIRPHIVNRWRDYLEGFDDDDAVWGAWMRLSKLEPEHFGQRCRELLETLVAENGDPSKHGEMQKVAATAPRWNPRVLDVLSDKQPKNMGDVADAYGELFAEVHQQWLKVLTETSLEAGATGQIIPDENARHLAVNSPINRQLRKHLYAEGTPTAVPRELAVKLLNRPIKDNLSGRKGAIENLHRDSPGSPPRAMSLRENTWAESFHVFRRGNPIDRGQRVEPRFLSAISDTAVPFPIGKRRFGLAAAITDPANPLTRRVAVNWVWQRHFGRGLVRTPDDFGTRGQAPTHPGLLDYLAQVLLEEGWSMKQLHRRIMLSRVYQQSAIEDPASRIKDPDNELLWRMPRQRLDMEAMRDAMLAVSGELDDSHGGRPFALEADPAVPRRTVYALINRDIVSPMLSTFDGPNPNSCTAKRPETHVPQQTLFALNSKFIQDRAAALASRTATARTDRERVQLLYRTALSRDPLQEELEIALRYTSAGAGETKTDPWQRLAHVLLASNEFVFID